MPNTKKEEAQRAAEAVTAAAEAFEASVSHYAVAMEAMRKGDYAAAKEAFDAVRAESKGEPELADRSLTYSRICERKLRPQAAVPTDKDQMLRHAVYLLNRDELDGALKWLNQALDSNPTSVDLRYVRACVYAKQGAAEKSVGDLRQAIAIDPKVRFQAVNDPDFERIREEPAFIDIIEPTPAGA
jgi:tetratricopeptide (TPR) repeat protein